MNSSRDDDPWSGFRLDTAEGHGLVRPRFQIHLYAEAPEATTVLRFFEAAQALIGDQLNWVDTGSGRWSRRTERTDSMVPTWCRDPVLWPKKVYTFIAQDSDQGIGDVELKITYAARNPQPPPAQWLQQVLGGGVLPKYFSAFSLALPVQHPLVSSGGVVDWILQSAPLLDPSFIGGSAGWGIDAPLNAPSSTQGPAARARAGALLQRHPGLSCHSHMGLGLARLKWDPDFARHKGAARARPYLTRADWITVLNADQLELVGGLGNLRATLARSRLELTLENAGSATLIRAGQTPQLGDLSIGYVPAEYRCVAQAVAAVCLPISDFKPSLGQAFDDQGLRNWYGALTRH